MKTFSRGGHSHRLYNIVTTASAVGQWSMVKADRKGAVNGQSALRIRSTAGRSVASHVPRPLNSEDELPRAHVQVGLSDWFYPSVYPVKTISNLEIYRV